MTIEVANQLSGAFTVANPYYYSQWCRRLAEGIVYGGGQTQLAFPD